MYLKYCAIHLHVQLYNWFVLYACIPFFLLIVLSYVVAVVYATLWGKKIAFLSFYNIINVEPLSQAVV